MNNVLVSGRIGQVVLACTLMLSCSCEPEIDPDDGKGAQFLAITLHPEESYQTIHNFGASDAWSTQFVGKNWPESKRTEIADYLFSTDLDSEGNPIGIGLSSWRFNIGAGSAFQGSSSNISDRWRRAESFMLEDGTYDWDMFSGQRWFLRAAKQRGVSTFTAFVNSPPVALTKNGKAYSGDGNSANIDPSNYGLFADYLAQTISNIEAKDAIVFDYLSPFNEPQWDWTNSGQEGSPWKNSEIKAFVGSLSSELTESGLSTKIEVPEAGKIEYLYSYSDKSSRGNQTEEFFSTSSNNYLGAFSNVAHKVAGHSYFSTWSLSHLVDSRRDLAAKVLEVDPSLEYWMTEYTLLENNSEINGNGRDLGMKSALYMARVLHADLTVANASAWQWWLAVSPYDYKDGLIYIDYDINDGLVLDSKMLWALGNYSRFIRPGMIRIGNSRSDQRTIEQTLSGVMVSSFLDSSTGKTVSVAINYGESAVPVKLINDISSNSELEYNVYVTSGAASNDLRYIGPTNFDDSWELPAKSITTFVEQ